MAFSENEFPILLEQLARLFNHESPLARNILVRELLKDVRDVPLYPGLIAKELPKALVPASIEQIRERLAKGESLEIIVHDGQREIHGVISGVTGEQIIISDAAIVTKTLEPIVVAVTHGRVVDSAAMKKAWPTLYANGNDDSKD